MPRVERHETGMKPTTSRPRPPPAKERILQAAMQLFARQPLTEVSLRDIASAAQVDVAYVHRVFGSKAEIFRQALHALHVVDLGDRNTDTVIDPDALIERICELALLRNPRNPDEVRPLHLIIQSCTCSEARDILADFIRKKYARPLAAGFGQDDIGPAMFAISLMTGFVTLRVALGEPTLQAMPEAQLKAMLARALRAAMMP